MVRGIVNLTQREMWVYGTSGKLIKLPCAVKEGEEMPIPEDGYYYAIDVRDNANKILEDYPEFYGKIAIPTLCGAGMNKEPIYTFETPSGVYILPITDGAGKSGTIVIRERGHIRHTIVAYAII